MTGEEALAAMEEARKRRRVAALAAMEEGLRCARVAGADPLDIMVLRTFWEHIIKDCDWPRRSDLPQGVTTAPEFDALLLDD